MQYSIISALSLSISIVSMRLIWDQRSKIKELQLYIDGQKKAINLDGLIVPQVK